MLQEQSIIGQIPDRSQRYPENQEKLFKENAGLIDDRLGNKENVLLIIYFHTSIPTIPILSSISYSLSSRNIFIILMRNHQLYRTFKSESSSTKYKTSQGVDAASNGTHAQNQKKFFDIDYIFQDPASVKPRRYRFEHKTQTDRCIEKNYKTLEVQMDMSASLILKPGENMLKVQPTKQKKLYCMQKTDLSFNKNTKDSSIHACKLNFTSSTLRNYSSKRQERGETPQAKPFEVTLSSKNYSLHRESRATNRQRRRVKLQRYKRKAQTNDSCQANKEAKRHSKIVESNQFQKYCEKNLQLAKNAFLLKNKQTIRIYRPWSPINFEEGLLDYEFGQTN